MEYDCEFILSIFIFKAKGMNVLGIHVVQRHRFVGRCICMASVVIFVITIIGYLTKFFILGTLL